MTPYERAIRQYLDGDYARPVGERWRKDGQPSKNDRCIHGVWMYDACEACIDAHFEAALAVDAVLASDK